jgi:alpha-glucosidase
MVKSAVMAWTAIAVTLIACSRSRVDHIAVESPSGHVRVAASVGDEGVSYSVERAGVAVILPSPLEIRLKDLGALAANATVVGTENSAADESGALPWGKVARVRNHYRGTVIHLRSASRTFWDLELRAYDDGVALRYGLPEQARLRDFVIEDEATEFRFAGSPDLTFGTLENFTTSHEPVYQTVALSKVPAGRLIEMPTLAVWPDGSAAAITEARIRDFAGMYLARPDGSTTALVSRLSPLPGRTGEAVAARTPQWSPWRVVLLGDRAGRLIESTTILALNDPATGDFSWARPGKTTWHWWNGVIEHGRVSTPEVNFALQKKYIDFCAAHGIAYHSVIGVADNRPWYVQGGAPGYEPRLDSDILTPRPDLGLPRILDYAREKHVGIRFWVYWTLLRDHLEEAFTRYEQWGIQGLMIDFLDRDDQQMVEWQERVLQSAARHHLVVQFHGSYKPSGEQRTYPNLFNREGVLNLEYLKWDDRCTPQHDVDVAYTRALAGPVDYHLGGFRAVPRDRFTPHELRPEILGTRAHQLALYVVFENPMPMVADYPDAYNGQAGFDFIEDVPTTWDDTRFVAGDPGQYVVVARRSGDRWYLGGINNWTTREVELPLAFLGSGTFAVDLRTDDRPDGSNPNQLLQRTETVGAAQSLRVTLASGGGVVAMFRRR